ncbi:MAG: hypothetical protein ABEJ97_05010 [Halobellus sp.]
MNDYGAMTVEVCETNETRHVCEYATPELKRQLASLPTGATRSLTMSRIGVRANVWRAVAVGGCRPDEAVAVGSEPPIPL